MDGEMRFNASKLIVGSFKKSKASIRQHFSKIGTFNILKYCTHKKVWAEACLWMSCLLPFYLVSIWNSVQTTKKLSGKDKYFTDPILNACSLLYDFCPKKKSEKELEERLLLCGKIFTLFWSLEFSFKIKLPMNIWQICTIKS